MAKVVLISTYDLGRQPFALASPAAWLRAAGSQVTCLDLACDTLDEAAIRDAGLIAFCLPMHTATRIALRVLERVKALNPLAHLCAYGLYAPMSSSVLRKAGVHTILGGEFEQGLVDLARSLDHPGDTLPTLPEISLTKQQFLVPERSGLPAAQRYARLCLPDGSVRLAGSTETSRGCRHLCRHCPIVPVYRGNVRLVQRNVVLADIRQQVEAGAQHITFGDADFFNAHQHGLEIVRALHRDHPAVSYDVTIKVEHLLQHRDSLPVLHDTGCAFVVTAVESVDDHVLQLLDKGHTRADFVQVAGLFRELGMVLSPTFVAFHPWLTLDSYQDLLQTIADLELVDHVAPVQWTIRLLITFGSRLLELPDIRAIIEPFDEQRLVYPWTHADARVDRLQRRLETMVHKLAPGYPRTIIFDQVWKLLRQARSGGPEAEAADLPAVSPALPRVTVPYLTEPWYC